MTTTTTIAHNVKYGSLSRQRLDLTMPFPMTSEVACVLIIHDGDWSGKGSHFSLEIGTVRELCTRAGVASASIAYSSRRTWTQQLNDAQLAIRYLRTNKATYRLSGEMAVYGLGAAGGLLALWLAILQSALAGDMASTYSTQSSAITAAVIESGAIDLTAEPLASSKDVFKFDDAGKASVAISQAAGISCPVFFSHGTDDKIAPYAEVASLAAALKAEGVDCTLVTYTGGHLYDGASSVDKDIARTRERIFLSSLIGSASEVIPAKLITGEDADVVDLNAAAGSIPAQLPAQGTPGAALFNLNMLHPALIGADEIVNIPSNYEYGIYRTISASHVNLWKPGGVATGGSDYVTLGAMVSSPDHGTNGQKIIESALNNEHFLSAGIRKPLFGGGSTMVEPEKYRFSVFVKAAERTRVVLKLQESHFSMYDYQEVMECGVKAVFDLANGTVAIPLTAYGMGIPANGAATIEGPYLGDWYKCTIVNTFMLAGIPIIHAKLSLDAGSGNAAENSSYQGNGSSGIYAWRSQCTPERAWHTLTNRAFFDDFNSLSTIDVNETKQQGFNWYPSFQFAAFGHRNAPSYVWPEDYDIANSVLTLKHDHSGSGVGLTSVASTGVRDGYVGNVFALPAMYEAKVAYSVDPVYVGSWPVPAFWCTAIEGMAADDPNTGSWPPDVPCIEHDFFEASNLSSSGVPIGWPGYAIHEWHPDGGHAATGGKSWPWLLNDYDANPHVFSHLMMPQTAHSFNLPQGQRNVLPNTAFAGAVVGSPGTLPNRMSKNVVDGCSIDVAGYTDEKLQLRIHGTVAGEGWPTVTFCTEPHTSANNNLWYDQWWCGSLYLRMVSGTCAARLGLRTRLDLGRTTPADTATGMWHFDHVDGSTNFYEATSGVYYLLVGHGAAHHDAAQKVFGPTSLHLDGVNSYLNSAGGLMWRFEGNFNLDLRIRLQTIDKVNPIFDFGGEENPTYPYLYVNAANKLVFSTNGIDRITGTTTLVAGTWYHVALSRVSGSVKLRLNGISEGSPFADATVYEVASTSHPRFGTNHDLSAFFSGWWDELRLNNGTSPFTADFTPASVPYDVTTGGFGSSGMMVQMPLSSSEFARYQAVLCTKDSQARAISFTLTFNASGTFDFTVELWRPQLERGMMATPFQVSTEESVGVFGIDMSEAVDHFGLYYAFWDGIFSQASAWSANPEVSTILGQPAGFASLGDTQHFPIIIGCGNQPTPPTPWQTHWDWVAVYTGPTVPTIPVFGVAQDKVNTLQPLTFAFRPKPDGYGWGGPTGETSVWYPDRVYDRLAACNYVADWLPGMYDRPWSFQYAGYESEKVTFASYDDVLPPTGTSAGRYDDDTPAYKMVEAASPSGLGAGDAGVYAVKPAAWAIDPDLVDPLWAGDHFWGSAAAVVPCWEGSGNPHYYGYQAAEVGQLSPVNSPTWGTNRFGPCLRLAGARAVADAPDWQIPAVGGEDIVPNTNTITILLVKKNLHDGIGLINYANSSNPIGTMGASNLISLDTGSTGYMGATGGSWAATYDQTQDTSLRHGYTITTAPECWALVISAPDAHTRLYYNGELVGDAGAWGLGWTHLNSGGAFSLNNYRDAVMTDGKEVLFFAILNTDWTAEQVLAWAKDPYAPLRNTGGAAGDPGDSGGLSGTRMHYCEAGYHMPTARQIGQTLRLAVIAKAAERSRIMLGAQMPAYHYYWFFGPSAIFDLASGTVVSSRLRPANPDIQYQMDTDWQLIDARMEPLNGGWYKCILEFVTPYYPGGSTTGARCFMAIDRATGTTATPEVDYVGDGVSGVYVWRSNMMDPRVDEINTLQFWDDFDDPDTCDINNTKAYGYNFYSNAYWPAFETYPRNNTPGVTQPNQWHFEDSVLSFVNSSSDHPNWAYNMTAVYTGPMPPPLGGPGYNTAYYKGTTFKLHGLVEYSYAHTPRGGAIPEFQGCIGGYTLENGPMVCNNLTYGWPPAPPSSRHAEHEWAESRGYGFGGGGAVWRWVDSNFTWASGGTQPVGIGHLIDDSWSARPYPDFTKLTRYQRIYLRSIGNTVPGHHMVFADGVFVTESYYGAYCPDDNLVMGSWVDSLDTFFIAFGGPTSRWDYIGWWGPSNESILRRNS